MRIITISREFGSGGRELGKRLADLLACDYYDSEIVHAVAQKSGMDAGYVADTLSNHGWQDMALTFRGTLSSPHLFPSVQGGAAFAAEEGAGGDRRAGQGLRYRGAQRGRYSEGLCAL